MRRNRRVDLSLFGAGCRDLRAEAQARDRALDLLAEYRALLVAEARAIALRICQERGRVTSSQVLAELRGREDLAAALAAADPRFMGVVFRGEPWKQLGWASTGSHRRRVPVWGQGSNLGFLLKEEG